MQGRRLMRGRRSSVRGSLKNCRSVVCSKWWCSLDGGCRVVVFEKKVAQNWNSAKPIQVKKSK